MRDIILRKTFSKQYLSEPLYEGDGGYRLVLNYGKDLTGCEIAGKVKRSDGTVVTYLGEVDGNYAYCTLGAGALNVNGEAELRLEIVSSDSVVTAVCAEGVIEKQLVGDEVASDDRYPVLTSLVNEVRALKEEVSSFDSQYLKTRYIWYANFDAVALASKPYIKIGSIEEFKNNGEVFTVMSASSVILTAVVPDLTATTVTPTVVVGDYALYNNGDLLVYAGNYLGYEVWKRLPLFEAKTNLDGLMSASDKRLLNGLDDKYYSLSGELVTMPKEITFHTEAALLNWISIDGIHYVKAQNGNGANPGKDADGLSYIIHVGREFDGTAFTGRRFQLAQQLKTNRWFYRVGNVNSGGSFNSISWVEITT